VLSLTESPTYSQESGGGGCPREIRDNELKHPLIQIWSDLEDGSRGLRYGNTDLSNDDDDDKCHK